jgi:hypothetical protein
MPQLLGEVLGPHATMFEYPRPGRATTFVDPVPRMMLTSDCIPTV